jgi:two-component system, NtrC family, sensor kinase
MVGATLKTRILVSFLLVILLIGLPVSLLGHYVVRRYIVANVQQEVERSLSAARFFYTQEIERIGEKMRLAEVDGDREKMRQKLGLDYLLSADKEDAKLVSSEIVRAAFKQKECVGGTRLILQAELNRIDPKLAQRSCIPIRTTQMSRPTDMKMLCDAMAKEYAVPVFDKNMNVIRVIYGGRIVNGDCTLIDKIRTLVFGDELYNARPVGTVTIFLDETRIATNVMAPDGSRAIGTRISARVYDTVVQGGQLYKDRAFVVQDWYMTAYEPIKNIDGHIIGVLYVGMLEKPYTDLARNIGIMALLIIVAATILASGMAVILAGAISRPLTHLTSATRKLSNGELAHRVKVEPGATEIRTLAESFNQMTCQLEERDKKLNAANEKLAALNKSYLDLIGFVAHELKGILASTMLNAYSVRDGFLGMVNFKQRKALDSITRNLDHLSATVQKFLSLSRIEKGELDFRPSNIGLRNDVFSAGIEALARSAFEKQMTLTNDIAEDVRITGDADLMQIVANNLVGNAIKYGTTGGKVAISSSQQDGKVRVEVYNDGSPITEEQMGRLFRKFSRLDTPEAKKARGTGLGLFITKEIIEKHGGKIWVEPREAGNAFVFEIERGV